MVFGSARRNFPMRRSIGDGGVGRERYSELIGESVEDDLGEMV